MENTNSKNFNIHVLVITQYFWPENFRINELVSELSKEGYELTILTGKPNYPEGIIHKEYLGEPQKYLSYQGVPIVRVPIYPRGSGKISLILNYISFVISASILGVYRLRKKHFDLIFVFEPSPITVGIPALVFKKLKKAPIVFWVLDLWPDILLALNVVSAKLPIWCLECLVRYIYKGCDLILGSSRGFELGISKYADDSKYRYFPNWSEGVFSSATLALQTPAQESNEYFDIVFTGNIGESQDFPAILNAAEYFKTSDMVRWKIIGAGRMFDWVKKEIILRDLSDRVFLLGQHPLEDMPKFYATASALLVSLKSDAVFALTLPGKLQSYMASGKPILGMLDGEGYRLINDSQLGYAAPAGDSASLADNIRQLRLMSKSELDKFGRNSLELTQTEFSKAVLVEKLQKHFAEVLN